MRLPLPGLPASDKMSYVKLGMGAKAILLGKFTLTSERPGASLRPRSSATWPRIGPRGASRATYFQQRQWCDQPSRPWSHPSPVAGRLESIGNPPQHSWRRCAIHRRPGATFTCRRSRVPIASSGACGAAATSARYLAKIGFPWETEDDFEATPALVRNVTTARRTADKGENVGAPTFGGPMIQSASDPTRRWCGGWPQCARIGPAAPTVGGRLHRGVPGDAVRSARRPWQNPIASPGGLKVAERKSRTKDLPGVVA